jgi:hypothetical protein
VGLNEPRLGQDGQRGPDGRIEALDVPHLDHEPAAGGRGDDRLSLLEVGRDRLLDEHVHARLEAREGDLAMRRGGHGDAHRVRALDELGEAVGRAGPELARDGRAE